MMSGMMRLSVVSRPQFCTCSSREQSQSHQTMVEGFRQGHVVSRLEVFCQIPYAFTAVFIVVHHAASFGYLDRGIGFDI